MPSETPHIPKFTPGQRSLSASELNTFFNSLPNLITGTKNRINVRKIGNQIAIDLAKDIPFVPPSSLLKTFVVLEEKDDYLICTPYVYSDNYVQQYDPNLGIAQSIANAKAGLDAAGPGTGGDEVVPITMLVAKPWMLQRAPWDDQTIKLRDVDTQYNYINPVDSNPGSRTRSTDNEEVVEQITPQYFPGDIIVAWKTNTGLVTSVDDGSGDPPVYVPIIWMDQNVGGREWSAAMLLAINQGALSGDIPGCHAGTGNVGNIDGINGPYDPTELQIDGHGGLRVGIPGYLYPPKEVHALPSIGSGNLPPGTWYYVITSVTQAGESTQSAEVSCVTTAPGGGGVILSWTHRIGAIAYNIYRSDVSGNYGPDSFVYTYNVNIDANFLEDPFASSFLSLLNTTYPIAQPAMLVYIQQIQNLLLGFLARSSTLSFYDNDVNPLRRGSPPIENTAKTGLVLGSLPAQPSTLISINQENQPIVGCWSNPQLVIDGSLGLGLKCIGTGAHTNNSTPDPIEAPSVSIQIQDGGSLVSGTTYYYVVTSYNMYGETRAGSQVSITAANPKREALLTWIHRAGAVGYRIYRSTVSGVFGSNSLVATITANPNPNSGIVTQAYPNYAVTAAEFNFVQTFIDVGASLSAGSPPLTNGAITGPVLFIRPAGQELAGVIIPGNQLMPIGLKVFPQLGTPDGVGGVLPGLTAGTPDGTIWTNGLLTHLGLSFASRPAITGSRGGNAALASLLTALAALGWITDSTT